VDFILVAASILLTLLAVIVAMAKIQRLPASLQIRDQAEVSPLVWTISGWIELLAAASLIIGVFVSFELALVAALVLLLGYSSLAARQLTRRRTAAAVPAAVLAALAALVIVAIAVSG
jgi:hypothetical protein